jgi:hypothetical protein
MRLLEAKYCISQHERLRLDAFDEQKYPFDDFVFVC